MKFLGITFTRHLRSNEHCKDLIRRAKSRLFKLWKLSNLNVNEESPLFLYSNACWLDLSQDLFNKIQIVQNRAYEFVSENQDDTSSKTPQRGKYEVSQGNADRIGQRVYSEGNKTQHTLYNRADI